MRGNNRRLLRHVVYLVVAVGPGLCSEDYNSRNTHCHRSSVSEVWYTLESCTVGVQAQREGEELGVGLGEGLGNTADSKWRSIQ